MNQPLLAVRDLKTHFTLGAKFPFRQRKLIKAVDGVTFEIRRGEALGLVGESGSGKSTIGRTLTRLEPFTSGEVLFDGTDILRIKRDAFRPFRREIQMIFQDPFASLNPRLRIEQILAEPLRIHRLAANRSDARKLIGAMLEQVGIDPLLMRRYPHEFSGGQRQRISIARAMILTPRLIIADEPVSSLDVSIQAQTLNLIKRLQRQSGISMLFISHDLGVIRHICDQVAVMLKGRIVEYGERIQIFEQPRHDYTRTLLAAVPGKVT